MIRAVIDANVIISSVIAPLGASRRIFEGWRAGAFSLVTSPGIIAEISRRLAHPRIAQRYAISDDDRAAIIRLLLSEALVAPGTRDISVTRDPTDNKIIAAAVESGSRYIVTGDKDLLAVGSYEGVRIVSPAEFVATISDIPDTE